MTFPRPDPPTASLASSLAPSLAAVLAMASLAAFQADPGAAAETGYLALATGAVLLAAGGVAGHGGRTAPETVAGPLLVTAAVWTLPAGPSRGAVALALAAAILVLAAVRWLSRPVPTSPAEEREGGGPPLPTVPVLALALGLQALLRGGELLLPPDGGAAWEPALRGAALFVGFPAVGAAAVLALERFHGRRRALLVAGAVLLMGPGFRPATLTVLLALAAAPVLLARGEAIGHGVLRGLRTGWGLRSTALALLAAPFAWDPRAAGAALAAGLAAALLLPAEPRRRPQESPPEARPPGRFGVWAPGVPAAVALAAALLLPGRAPEGTVALAALVPLAVPALALPRRDRVPAALAALLLAFAAARGVLVEGALAAPAALAALAVPRRGAVAAVQGAWSGGLLAAAGLLAAYPWLRSEPLPAALRLLGVTPGWPGVLAAVAGVAGLVFLGILLRRSRWAGSAEATAGGAGVAVLAGLVLLQIPTAGATPLEPRSLVLDRDHRSWTAPMGGEATPVRTLVLDSTLAHAIDLPPGTPVATLRLRDPFHRDRVWTLRAGSDSGEWAADRPDLRDRRPAAPPPWLSWVAEEGGFFGRRYRALRHLREPVAPNRIELDLRPDLPPEVVLTVHHLELRP